MMHDGWGAGAWVATALVMLVFWGLVIGGLVWLLAPRATAPPTDRPTDPPPPVAGPTARDVLDERYARGEIDDEEYRRRRATLADAGAAS